MNFYLKFLAHNEDRMEERGILDSCSLRRTLHRYTGAGHTALLRLRLRRGRGVEREGGGEG